MSWTKILSTNFFDDNDVSSEETVLLFVLSNLNNDSIEKEKILEFFSDLKVS
jgi:hypothetical protein